MLIPQITAETFRLGRELGQTLGLNELRVTTTFW
jgi:hypothetical protein